MERDYNRARVTRTCRSTSISRHNDDFREMGCNSASRGLRGRVQEYVTKVGKPATEGRFLDGPGTEIGIVRRTRKDRDGQTRREGGDRHGRGAWPRARLHEAAGETGCKGRGH